MTRPESASGLRWNPGFERRGGDFRAFWKDYLSSGERQILYVAGRGFDPRMCSGIEELSNLGAEVRFVKIVFDEGTNSPSMMLRDLIEENEKRLAAVLGAESEVTSHSIDMWAMDGLNKRRVSCRSAAGVFNTLQDFRGCTDIVLDASAMPRSILFPLLAKTLSMLDGPATEGCGTAIPSLHVVVCENPLLDSGIQEVGVDEAADYVHGFGVLDTQASADTPMVWIPLLGEDQRVQLERIHALVNPSEISPVLPSPSRNPRRADDIVYEYRDLLFNQWNVEPSSYAYASENSPFEVYRTLCRITKHYNRSLQALGGCRIALSSVSSKVLSIGMMLAAYEMKKGGMKVGIAHIEPDGYRFTEGFDPGTAQSRNVLVEIGLTGELC